MIANPDGLNFAPKVRDPLREALKAAFVAAGKHTICPPVGSGDPSLRANADREKASSHARAVRAGKKKRS